MEVKYYGHVCWHGIISHTQEVAAYRAKSGMGPGAKRGPGRPAPPSMKQVLPQDDDDEDDDEEDDDEDDD